MGGKIFGCLGSEPRLAMSHATLSGSSAKPPLLWPGGGGMSVLGLCVVFICGWVWSWELAEPIGSGVPVRGG